MISVTGGKGGVGKTFFSINLALQLARQGFKTCLFDADLGLSNIDVMLGLNPAHTLADVFDGQKSLPEILIRNYQGIDIIPGGSGIERLTNLPDNSLGSLTDAFAELDPYDFILFDTAAGISRNVISFCLAGKELIVVITPEPTSITDAYALLKVLLQNGLQAEIMVVFNQIKKVATAKKAYRLFNDAVLKHLRIKIKSPGFVFQDAHVPEAVRMQQSFLSVFPNSKAAACIKQIAANLVQTDQNAAAQVDPGIFWKKYLASIQKKDPLFDPAPKVRVSEEHTDLFDETRDISLYGMKPAPEETAFRDTQNATASPPPPFPDAAATPIKPEPNVSPSYPAPIDPTGALIQAVRSVTEELKQIRKVLENSLGKRDL